MIKSLTFVERSITIFWQRLEYTCSNDAHSLGLFRIFWGTYILLFFAPYSAFVAQVPQSFYNPPVLSLAYLFSGFPPYWLMLAGDLVGIWLLVLITIGVRTRLCTIVLCLLTFISRNFVYSFGKIDHDALMWAVALCLAFTDWGSTYALVPDPRINPKVAARALATAGVLIAFGMFTAGFDKALHWINFDLSTSGFLCWFYGGYYTLDRKLLLAPFVLKVHPHLTKILDFAAVAIELSPFFFLLAGRAAWRAWLLIATCFHLANALLLNISFYNHVLVYLPFVAFSRFFGRPNAGDNTPNAVFSWRVPVILFAVILGVAHTIQRVKGGGSSCLFIEGDSVVSISLYVSLVLLALCSVLIAFDLTGIRLWREAGPVAWNQGTHKSDRQERSRMPGKQSPPKATDGRDDTGTQVLPCAHDVRTRIRRRIEAAIHATQKHISRRG
jgi:hypothetical protein